MATAGMVDASAVANDDPFAQPAMTPPDPTRHGHAPDVATLTATYYDKDGADELDRAFGLQTERERSDARRAGEAHFAGVTQTDHGPKFVVAQRNRFGNSEPVGTQPVPYVYRAVSEDDWERMQATGNLNSDGRANIDTAEGMVAAAGRTPRAYLPEQATGRILRIRVDEQDGWWADERDGYMKTPNDVPIDRVDLTSPVIHPPDDTGRRAIGRQ